MKQTIKKIAYSNCIFKFIYEFMRKVKNKLLAIFSQLYKKICDSLPIKKNKIIFDNFGGQGYGGNPKYIAEEIIRQKLDWDLVWMVSDLNEPLPPQIRKVKTNSLKSYFEWSTAKVWIDNIRNAPKPGIKKKGQVYLQTWHGNFGCKIIEADAENKLNPAYVKIAKEDGRKTDAIFALTGFDDNKIRELFWLQKTTELLRFGFPEYDIFFNEKYSDECKKRIQNKFGIKKDEYVILYAPTFRDSYFDAYLYAFDKLISAFEKATKKKCIVIVRMHPNAKGESKKIQYNESIINASEYTDPQELSFACDCVVSDYSSIIYDFVLQNKPVFLYVPDIEIYQKERGIRNCFFEWPFPKYENENDFYDKIKNFNYEAYVEKVKDYFLFNQIYEKGESAKQAVDWVAKALRNNK